MKDRRSAGDSPASHQQFQLLVDSVRDYAIFMLDTTGHVQTWNRGAERIKGYKADEILGRHFSTFYPLADIRSGKPRYELETAIEVGRFEDEGWRIRKDGSPFWANVVITAVRDGAGELVGFAKVTRDLTERKRAEDEREALLVAERTARIEAERARTHIDALQHISEAALSFTDTDEFLHAAVREIAEVFAVEHAAVLQREGDELVTLASFGEGPPSGTRERITLTRAGRVVSERAPVIVIGIDEPGRSERRDGASWLGVPLVAENEVIGVVHIASNDTGRFRTSDATVLQLLANRVSLALEHARIVRAERDARLSVMLAEESARLRDEFIAIAAHELKTPLTALSVSAQLALRRTVESESGARPLIEQVLAQASKMNRLVLELLESSRVESGRLTLQYASADVSAIVRDITALLARASARDVRVSAPPALIAEVDALRVEQLVANLVDNAIKYSPPDTPVEVALRSVADAVELVVRDHGEGIAPAQRDRLFQRYSRGETQRTQPGLGLGLYIARAIVNAHGGEITATFPPGGGSTFTVTLPLAKPARGEAPLEPHTHPA